VVLVGETSPFTNGRVKLTPSSPADAPNTLDSLAFAPRVTVLVQPDTAKSRVPTVSVTSILIRAGIYKKSLPKSILFSHSKNHLYSDCIDSLLRNGLTFLQTIENIVA